MAHLSSTVVRSTLLRKYLNFLGTPQNPMAWQILFPIKMVRHGGWGTDETHVLMVALMCVCGSTNDVKEMVLSYKVGPPR